MADVKTTLRWTGERLRFEAGGDDHPWIPVDGSGKVGPRPMELLLISLAGCMAADIVEILRKMRVPLEALEVRVEGDRAPDPPRRYTRIHLVCEPRGTPADAADKVRRAVALSEDKYCSVLHTLRPDAEVRVEVVLG